MLSKLAFIVITKPFLFDFCMFLCEFSNWSILKWEREDLKGPVRCVLSCTEKQSTGCAGDPTKCWAQVWDITDLGQVTRTWATTPKYPGGSGCLWHLWDTGSASWFSAWEPRMLQTLGKKSEWLFLCIFYTFLHILYTFYSVFRKQGVWCVCNNDCHFSHCVDLNWKTRDKMGTVHPFSLFTCAVWLRCCRVTWQ